MSAGGLSLFPMMSRNEKLDVDEWMSILVCMMGRHIYLYICTSICVRMIMRTWLSRYARRQWYRKGKKEEKLGEGVLIEERKSWCI